MHTKAIICMGGASKNSFENLLKAYPTGKIYNINDQARNLQIHFSFLKHASFLHSNCH